MSISEKLTRLQNAKTDIKDAIVNNGGTVEQDDGLEEYPTRITNRFGEVNYALSILLKGPTLISKTITENGEYLAEDDNADGYSSVLVNVESYTIADAGKVVNSTGTGLVSQTSYGTVTTNGTIDTTYNNSITVNVPSLPSGITMCKLTALTSNVSDSDMYLINLVDKTILTGYVNKNNSTFEEVRFSYPNTFTPTHSSTDKSNNVALYSEYNSIRVNYYGAGISYEMSTTNRTVSFYDSSKGKYYFCMIFS